MITDMITDKFSAPTGATCLTKSVKLSFSSDAILNYTMFYKYWALNVCFTNRRNVLYLLKL